MKQVSLPISEFKAKCLRLLEDLSHKGISIIVTKRGRPIAKVMPVSTSRKPFLGSGAGTLRIKGDIVHFDTSDEWEANKRNRGDIANRSR
jgi:prevent-host-death family protein